MGKLSNYGFKNHFDVVNTSRFMFDDINIINLQRDPEERSKFTYEDSYGNLVKVNMLKDGTANFKVEGEKEINLTIDESVYLISNNDPDYLSRLKKENKKMIDSYAKGGELKAIGGKLTKSQITGKEKGKLLDVLYKAKFDAEQAGNKNDVTLIEKLISKSIKGADISDSVEFKTIFAQGGNYFGYFNETPDTDLNFQPSYDYAKGGNIIRLQRSGNQDSFDLTRRSADQSVEIIKQTANDFAALKGLNEKQVAIMNSEFNSLIEDGSEDYDGDENLYVEDAKDLFNKHIGLYGKDHLATFYVKDYYAKGGEVDAIMGISKNLKNSTSTETSFYPIRAKVPTKFIQEVGFKLENKDDYVKVTEIQFDTKKIILQGYDEDGENYDGDVGYKLDGLSKDFQKWIKRNLIRKARRERGNSYFAKGGKTQEIGFNTYKTLSPNKLQDLGYSHGQDAVRKIPKSIFSQEFFMEYVSAYVKQFYDYAEISKDFSENNYSKGGYILSSFNKDKITDEELDTVLSEINDGYGWITIDGLKQTIEMITGKEKFDLTDKVDYLDDQRSFDNIIEYLRNRTYVFPTEDDEKLGNTNDDINILSVENIKRDRSGPWATSGTSIYEYYISADEEFGEAEIYKWAEDFWRTSIEAPISRSFELGESGGADNNPNDVPLHGYLSGRNEWVLTVKETIYYN